MNIRPKMSFVTTAGLLFVALVGCGHGPALPDDLPPLTSCKVDVVYKGVPVTEATVTLVPADGKWVGVGMTDQQGQAIIKTQGRYPGVPAGSYAVTVTKYDEQAEPPPTASTPEEDALLEQSAKRMPPRKALVPEKYLKAESSDLKITVTESAVEETLNLQDG
ncbi:carboxypeptidase-like regulatory domain-containing protein [Bremerella alba]|uniref:Carboxypeptidase regulatory-like domain-containing protein n=1 Tax=Bremerella alba TaxID=980252 RepID=A0A7V9A8F3_9BACT|nr:carboxypeptidase-like regulatory domain-containing protein [Bremerella alba]MBA2116392.1 hypothetical protein [Bremerella alba]